MSKALIEKAKADYWKRKKLIAHEHKPKTLVTCSFQDGATWQRKQLIKELREWIESNKELRGYTGIPDDTLNIILAKLDLLSEDK